MPVPSLLASIAKWTTDAPTRPAVTDRGATITYGQLGNAIDGWASLLAGHGAGAGDAVGLLPPNRREWVPMLLAVARIGAVAVLFPPSLPARDLRPYAEIAGARLVLAGAEHHAVIGEASGRPSFDGPDRIRGFGLDVPRAAGIARGDAIVQLTSGADQPAKLAVRTHDALWDEIAGFAEEIQLGRGDATLVLSSISHSYGLIGGTLAPLCHGGSVILADGFDGDAVFEAIGRGRPTMLFGVPAMYRALLRASARAGVSQSTFRLCLSAGAPLPHDLDDAFARRFGRRISQDYGSTETGVITLRLCWTPHLRDSVGRAVRGRRISVIGANGEPVAPGTPGEVVVASAALARGYLDEVSGVRALDAAGFHTGDLGRIDADGHLFLTGRKSSLVHVANVAVDPAAVEAVLAEIPGVRDAAVVGVRDAAGGETVKAVVVATGITGDEVIRRCRERLPDTHVPRAVEFRAEIPRTAAGKPLRRLLR